MSRFAHLLGAPDERLLAIEARLDRHTERLDAQREQLQRQAQLLEQQQQRLDRQRERLRQEIRQQADVRTDMAKLNVAYPVLLQQMASFETRLQQLLDTSSPDGLDAGDAERVEAKNLLEEVRREHSRIRVRFGVVSRYEERVRRLEEAIEATQDHSAPSRGATDEG